MLNVQTEILLDPLDSKNVSLTQSIYYANQTVLATNTASVIQIESLPQPPITPLLPGADPIDIGSASLPGLYPVTFVFGDGTSSILLVGISDPANQVDNSIFSPMPAVALNTAFASIFTQVVKFFQEEPFDVTSQPFKSALADFCLKNTVTEVKNVSFCIAAASADFSVGVLNTLCEDMTIDNLKAVTLAVYDALFKTMHDLGYLNDQQYQDLQLDDYVNLMQMLQKDCSAFFDFIANQINNDDVKLAIQFQGQLCSSAVTIIKYYNATQP